MIVNKRPLVHAVTRYSEWVIRLDMFSSSWFLGAVNFLFLVATLYPYVYVPTVAKLFNKSSHSPVVCYQMVI